MAYGLVEKATGVLALHLVAAVHAGEADGHQVGQHSRERTLTNGPVHAAHTQRHVLVLVTHEGNRGTVRGEEKRA